MAERPEAEQEGWHVPQRLPTIVAVATPLVLLMLLISAGWLYNRTIAPKRHQPITTFPAPGVETDMHDGGQDPPRQDPPPPPDPAVERAKRAVAADGLPGWGERR